MNGGFGGISSGADFGRGEGASCFLRAFPVADLAFPIASDFGSAGAIGGGRGGPFRGGGEAGPEGGDTEGSGEGGDTDVMSTDGDRCREGGSKRSFEIGLWEELQALAGAVA